MKLSSLLTVAVSACTLVLGPAILNAQANAPDNTKVNKQHKTTADKANNNNGDLDLMKNIRKAVMNDKSLSTYAHNTKIIAQGGKVTLKGPVKSPDEKSTVERLANEIAGAGNVVNQITVKPASKK